MQTLSSGLKSGPVAGWFFLYGTLLDRDRNPVAAALHARLEPGQAATVPGRLYAIPDAGSGASPDAGAWYPALIPGEPGLVYGMLHAASPAFTPADLAQMDSYEDFTPEDVARSEYVRRLLPVAVDSPDPANRGADFAHVYCYNRPLPAAAVAIPAGDFGAWRRETGACAYGSTA